MAHNHFSSRAERRTRPGVEHLEPRRLLAAAIGDPFLIPQPPGVESHPSAILAGGDQPILPSFTDFGERFAGRVAALQSGILAEPAPVAALVDDPANPGLMILSVAGTNADDTLYVEQHPEDDALLRVRSSDIQLDVFPRAAVSRIVIHGFDGNDTLGVDAQLTTPAEIHGGNGNDQIVGGSGRDLLSGGLGDDSLSGGEGRDLLVGGLGLDVLRGDEGDDILIGGRTAYDEHDIALLELLSAWETSSGCGARITGLNERLTADTLIDDAVRDTLLGSPGTDWVLDFLLQDRLPDVRTNLISLNRVCSPYQNPLPLLSRDVNGDGFVSPLDALQVINRINRDPLAGLPDRSLTPPPHYWDVDGNGQLSPLDALLVINQLNRGTR